MKTQLNVVEMLSSTNVLHEALIGSLVKNLHNEYHIFTQNDGQRYGQTVKQVLLYATSPSPLSMNDWAIVTAKHDSTTKYLVKVMVEEKSQLYSSNDIKFVKEYYTWEKVVITNHRAIIGEDISLFNSTFINEYISKGNLRKPITVIETEFEYSISSNTGMTIETNFEIANQENPELLKAANKSYQKCKFVADSAIESGTYKAGFVDGAKSHAAFEYHKDSNEMKNYWFRQFKQRHNIVP